MNSGDLLEPSRNSVLNAIDVVAVPFIALPAMSSECSGDVRDLAKLRPSDVVTEPIDSGEIRSEDTHLNSVTGKSDSSADVAAMVSAYDKLALHFE